MQANRKIWPVLAVALAALALGAAGGMWYARKRMAAPAQAAPAPPLPPPAPAPAVAEAEDLIVSVPADSLERMNLKFGVVTAAPLTTQVRVPAAVAPNAYRVVPVSPVAGGIATEIRAELGQSVRRGEKMAQLFSREIAEAQSALIGFQAELDLEHKKLTRVQELVELGAASRQELEEIQSEHRLHQAHVEEARQKLLYLGLTPEQVDRVNRGEQIGSDIVVPAPQDGVVLSRSVNLGQVVGAGQELFTVADLSSVWIEGSLLENDFAAVRVGSQATATTPAYPGRVYRGTVAYIDPRVDPQTRTAKVRVELENRDLALRLGMYMDLTFSTGGGVAALAPPQAVQQIGVKSVVFLPVEGEPNRFRQRTVVTGGETGTGVRVMAGLRPGDRVVTEGSFLLRSESLRRYRQ
jgi:cobalt-zinc-cadmium efflux system membrane fusion protein